jgi:hypothetical protein
MTDRARGSAGLVFAVGLAAAWLGVNMAFNPLASRAELGGIIGVVLGLFVCSLPARHFLDLLLYRRTEGKRFRGRGALAWWLAANAAVMLVGWLTIVIGATRFTSAR